jgi:nitroreductase
VIEERRSARRFRRAPISGDQLTAVLEYALAPLSTDFEASAPLTEAFLIANAVEGLAAGPYRWASGGPVLIRAGDFRTEATHLALGQEAAGEAAVNIYFMSDLEPLLAALGNRGYRAAQLEGGIRGGRVYLAATALGLGATGLTFFDDEAAALFGAAAREQPMFLVTIGR